MKEGFREKGIYRLVNAGLLAGVALFGGARFLGIGSLTAMLVVEALVALGLLAGINFLPLRGKFFCLAAAALGMAAAVSAAGVEESFLFLRAYFPWLMGTGGGYGEWADGYAFLQTMIIVVLCYVIQIIFEKLPGVKLLFAALLLAGAVLCLPGQRTVPHWGMAFGICYIVTVYVEWAERRWKKVRTESSGTYMLRIMPFLAAYLLLMGCMPAPEAPYEWKWVKNVFHQFRETFQVYAQKIKWGGREGFDMAFSGFSEEAVLRGGLQETAETVMTVQLRNTAPMNVYLTGMVYDTFDGRQWQQACQGDPKGVFLDAAETLGAVMAFDEQYQKDYIHNAGMRICYQDFNSAYVFAPLKTWEIKSKEGGLAYTCEGGSLRLEGSRGYGTTYELQYYQLNDGQEEFYRFLEACSDKSAASLGAAQYTGQAVWEEMEELGIEDMAAYRRGIYENYLGEVELSEEAAEYLDRITKGAGTDVEKLRAIQRELSSFVYTRTPGDLPKQVTGEKEFLDYFLLESRQGYCTYFATAFVLLARAEGVPARYVQGFCIPAQSSGEICVYSNMAHAWPEVYIPGAGWIPFEPTPGYGEMRRNSWELSRPDAAEEAGAADREDWPGDVTEAGKELQGEDGEIRPKEELTPEAEDGEEGRFGHLWKGLGYTVPVILAGYVLLLLMDNVWSRYRYRRMCPEEKFKLEVSRNLRLLSMLGMKRGKRETLQEFRDRCRLKTDFGEAMFIESYESIVYGGRSVSEAMVRETARERRELMEQLKRKKRWAYIRWRVRSFLIRYR